MKNLFRIIIFILVVGFYSVSGPTVLAAETTTGIAQLAQCSGPDCSACNVVYMANGLIKWLIGILCVLFAVLLAIAGVKLVVSRGNTSALDAAKDSFVNAIIGFLIVLSAWLIVDTIMRSLVGNEGRLATDGDVTGWLYWSEVTCQKQTVPDENAWVEVPQDFGDFGLNSFQVYLYNPTNSCKTIANTSLPDRALCQSALASVQSSASSNGQSVFVVQDCTGILNTEAPPTWNSAPLCGGGVSGGSSKILTLSGGGTIEVLACGAGAADRQTISFLGGSAHVQKNLVPSLQRIDARWRALGGGDTFYRVTSVGGYNCRTIAGSSRLSVHAYGLAVDINPAQNPHGPTLISDMPPAFVNLFTSEGWGWGGNWRSSKDAMHFSKDKGEQGNMSGQ
jgi:hypothetical protein